MELTQLNAAFTNIAARTDYGANSGTADWSEPYTPEPRNVGEVINGTITWPNTQVVTTYGTLGGGVCYEGESLPLRKVIDGTSKTYMVGEKYLNPDHYATGRGLSDDWSMYSGHQDDNHRVTGLPRSDGTCKIGECWQPLRDRAGLSNRTSYGSSHNAVWNVVMCDGSVQSNGYDIDMITHAMQANRKDEGQLDLR